MEWHDGPVVIASGQRDRLPTPLNTHRGPREISTGSRNKIYRSLHRTGDNSRAAQCAMLSGNHEGGVSLNVGGVDVASIIHNFREHGSPSGLIISFSLDNGIGIGSLETSKDFRFNFRLIFQFHGVAFFTYNHNDWKNSKGMVDSSSHCNKLYEKHGPTRMFKRPVVSRRI